MEKRNKSIMILLNVLRYELSLAEVLKSNQYSIICYKLCKVQKIILHFKMTVGLASQCKINIKD